MLTYCASRAIFVSAGVAQHAGVTRLLLERGADPNDEETPYHVAERRNNDVLRVLLESGNLNTDSALGRLDPAPPLGHTVLHCAEERSCRGAG
jgi:hypothetical protein